ncbi:polysaccharide deacetylase family protein [Shimia isoporae]|uniref:polysaccharide deacetylase family protein n=1 Tax=Shimia isoporae TaxID=647720 RepID=UPI00140473AD|nr:polysaccharide deacetylase family protein [Shimia isoporae]
MTYVAFQISKSTRFQFFGELVARGPIDCPRVALTLDDGPSTKYTASVLQTLARHNVQATFFLTGDAATAHPELVSMIASAGHEIGNHSFSHPRMIGMRQATIAREIEDTDTAIRNAGYDGPLHFRPPFGKRFLGLPYYLKKTNRLTVLWDISAETDPTRTKDPNEIAQRTIDASQNGSIILLHVMFNSRQGSRDALPKIIEGIRAKGLEFATISDLIDPQNCPAAK